MSEDLNIADFAGLEFDLSGESWFERVPGFGIRLIPIIGHPVSVAGHGYNNGYYSSELTLELRKVGERMIRLFYITECQETKGQEIGE